MKTSTEAQDHSGHHQTGVVADMAGVTELGRGEYSKLVLLNKGIIGRGGK